MSAVIPEQLQDFGFGYQLLAAKGDGYAYIMRTSDGAMVKVGAGEIPPESNIAGWMKNKSFTFEEFDFNPNSEKFGITVRFTPSPPLAYGLCTRHFNQKEMDILFRNSITYK